MVYLYDEILLSNKNRHTMDTHNTISKHGEQKKPRVKAHPAHPVLFQSYEFQNKQNKYKQWLPQRMRLMTYTLYSRIMDYTLIEVWISYCIQVVG